MRRQIPRCLMGIFFCMVFLGLMRSSCAADPIAYYKNGTEWYGSSDIKGSTESFENNDLTVSIIAKGGKTENDIYGIYNETDNKVLLSNQVTIETFNSNYSLHDLCGAYSTGNDCKISSNSVTVTVNNDSKLSLNSIYGGYSTATADYCNISSNTVTVNNATMNNQDGGYSVSGAYIENCGEASYNTVNIYNSQINALNHGEDILIGAYIGGGKNSSQEYSNATHNTINITNSTAYQIIGAIVKSDTLLTTATDDQMSHADYNKIIIDNSSVKTIKAGDISNGRGSADFNEINIKNGRNLSLVFGGISSLQSNSNTINIDSSNSCSYVIGGQIYGIGEANRNKVTVTNTSFENSNQNNTVYGGFISFDPKNISEGNLEQNEVLINNGTFTAKLNNISGGCINNEEAEGKGYGYAISNKLTIKDSSFTAEENNNEISGGQSNLLFETKENKKNKAEKNEVVISGSTFTALKNNIISGGSVKGLGDAASNTVSISDSIFKGETNIYGGYANEGDASYNTVKLSDVAAETEYIIAKGGSSGQGYANYNTITVSNGSNIHITGGQGFYGATNNSVNVDKTNALDIKGGFSIYGDVASNSVIIKDSIIKDEVYGGEVYGGDGNAIYNSVDIASCTVANPNSWNLIVGGKTGEGEASYNKIKITDSNINNNESENLIYGGFVGSNGNANYNSIDIANTSLLNVNNENKIIGGLISVSGNSNHNTINIASATFVIQKIESETVDINDYNFVFGGYVGVNGDASSNTVNIASATFDTQNCNQICGGLVQGKGDASSNIVSIANSKFINAENGNDVNGGYTMDGNASNNTVDISESIFQNPDNETINAVYGGHAENAGNAADHNIVNISKSSLNIVYGGFLSAYPSDSSNGNSVSYNTVNIKDSNINSGIFGGYIYNDGIGSASYNTVNIAGSTIDNDNKSNITIFGGEYAPGEDYYEGNADYNSVTITDSKAKGSDIYVVGGERNNGSTNNNTINISNSIFDGKEYISVYGGSLYNKGESNYNKINITDSTFNAEESESNIDIFAGFIYEGITSFNETNITNTKFVASSTINLCGGITTANSVSNSVSNKLSIASTSFDSQSVSITTGVVYEGDAYSNVLSLDNISLKAESVYINGGETNNGKACQNSVNITNSTIDGSDVYIKGGHSAEEGKANYNEINIYNSKISGKDGCEIIGGHCNPEYSVETRSNIVRISDSSITGEIYGGRNEKTDNQLFVSGIANSSINIYNFETVNFNVASSTADKALLSITDTKENLDLSGVCINTTDMPLQDSNSIVLVDAQKDIKYSDTTKFQINGTDCLANNSMTLTESDEENSWVKHINYQYDKSDAQNLVLKYNTIITASYSENGEETSSENKTITITDKLSGMNQIYGIYSDNGEATGATIKIDKALDLSNTSLIGGYSADGGNVSGNTLDVSTTDLKIKSIENFDNYVFTLSGENYGKNIISTTDTVNLKDASVNVNLSDGSLAKDQQITLFDKIDNIDVSKLSINGINGQSLRIAAEGKEYINVGETEFTTKNNCLALKGKEAFLAAAYINSKGEKIEKADKTIILTDTATAYDRIYGIYSDNGEATGATIKIDKALDLSNTSLIGGYAPEGFKVAGCTLDVSAKDIKVKSVSAFDKIAFTINSDINSGDTVLKLADAVNLKDITIDLKLDSVGDDFVLNKGEKIVLADKVTGKDKAVLKLNGEEKDSIKNTAINDEYVRVRSLGYDKSDSSALTLVGLDDFIAGGFIDASGKIHESRNGRVITLGKSASGNIKANVRAADSGPDIDFSKMSDIYGIYSDGSADATGAEVNIDSAINYNDTILHGGYSRLGKVYGNTLNVKAANAQVKGITDFENLNFVLGADVRNGDTMLKVTDKVDLKPTNNIGVDGTSATGLHIGDSVNLLVSAAGIEGFASQTITISGLTDKNGVVELSEPNTLKLDLKKENQNANTKAPAEGIAAAAILVNEASDLTAGALNRSMLEMDSNDMNTFAAIGGGHTKTETGSYVKNNSWNLGFGIGKKGLSTKNPNTTYGMFFQYGKSNFDTHNGSFRGDGDAKNLGFGLMYHSEGRNNYYYDGAAYIGKLDAKWSCVAGGYDESATYRGITLGMGHRNYVKDNRVVDTYGKYFFNHTNAMSGVIDGHSYSFDSVDSSRIRLGLRIEQIKNKSARPYFGFAWEHEFSGDARSSMDLGRVDAPSLKGDTGIVEIGYRWKRGNWDINVNAEGSFGKREGVTGAASFYYNF